MKMRNRNEVNFQRPPTMQRITIATIENATNYINALRKGVNARKMESIPQKVHKPEAKPTAKPTQKQDSPARTSALKAAVLSATARATPVVENIMFKVSPANMSEFHPDKYRRALWSIYSERIMASFNHRRIFIDYRNCAPVRKALLQRGWLEKMTPYRYRKIQNLSDEKLITYARSGSEYEAVAISRLLESFPAFFIWQGRNQSDYNVHMRPYRNVIRRGRDLDFTTKIGLIGCAEQASWYFVNGQSDLRHPRFYRLAFNNEERFTFIKDFQLTQCVGFLKAIKEKFQDVRNPPYMVNGPVPLTVLHFAIYTIKRFLFEVENELIDNEVNLKSDAPNTTIDWARFIAHSRDIFKRNAKFNCTYKEMMDFFISAESVLKRLLEKFPNRKWDGKRNLWILKPAYECRGQGILVRNDLDEIFKYVSEHQRDKYIVQKYIETPLLIFKTKFDIRQYMLLQVTDRKLNIWLYKDCYLRFSGQEFNLDSLHASIHLTNNSVQVKYANSQTRDARLPPCNMWSLDELQNYFQKEVGNAKIWDSKIFPGFKKNLVAVTMASLEDTELVPNCFELYGCDFMLDEQFEPILIEINSNPDMSPSTYVTERLCPRVLHDLVKVIVDTPMNQLAPTGEWELAHGINYTFRRMNAVAPNLSVTGKSMKITPMTPVAKLLKITKSSTIAMDKPKIIKRTPIANR